MFANIGTSRDDTVRQWHNEVKMKNNISILIEVEDAGEYDVWCDDVPTYLAEINKYLCRLFLFNQPFKTKKG